MKALKTTRERFKQPEPSPFLTDMREATRLSDAGELDDAWSLVDKWLLEDPNEPMALTVASHIMEKAKKFTVAYSLAKRVTELRPDRPEGWINLGRCADDLWRLNEAIEHYEKALERAAGPKSKLTILNNLAAVIIQDGRFAQAEPYCRQALMIDPDDSKSRHNLGLCLLARHEWKEGWKYYSASIGSSARRRIQYNKEPVWDGSRGKTVAIYGEQGIGDEIMFASMIPDAVRDCKKVIIDCDPRLKGLFQRSFQKAKVYGTRNDQAINWDQEDRSIDASISVGELGRHYRRLPSDFSGAAYLDPCPDRSAMWRSLFKEKGKPVIGIAWSGGAFHTGARDRYLSLEQWKPLFDAVDAHWVSLQYKDASREIAGTPVVQYPYATLTKDYDDTAALVSALDLVVSVPTAVVHLAGALGVPTIAMKGLRSCWKFENALAFHPQVQLINNSGWDDTVRNVITKVQACIASS